MAWLEDRKIDDKNIQLSSASFCRKSFCQIRVGPLLAAVTPTNYQWRNHSADK
jgi:hypothetical protein